MVTPVKNGGGLDKGDNKRDIFKVGELFLSRCISSQRKLERTFV